jgi:hypothetical protein
MKSFTNWGEGGREAAALCWKISVVADEKL